MKEFFISLLHKHNLYDIFIAEYGSDFESVVWHKGGWCFGETDISYRAAGLFDDYSEGYNWKFNDDEFTQAIYDILISEGFVVEHNGGDEDDGLFHIKLN